MLKKLLLTVALLSSTYGTADIEYFDPDFSLLANRSETLVVNENGIVVDPDKSKPWVLRRLTQAEVSEAFNSNGFEVLCEADFVYSSNIWGILILYIKITSDCTPNNGISKAQDAKFLCQLFWSRVSLIEQLLQVKLLSPHITTDDPTEITKRQQEKLAVFSKKYDHAGVCPKLCVNSKRGIKFYPQI